MDITRPQIINGEQVYVVTAIGTPLEEVEAMKREVRRVKVQEHIKRYEETHPTVGLIVDTEL
jgi:hypothetical protein